MSNEIYLYGTVGVDFWGEEFFTPSMVQEMLEGQTGALTVRINSGGGIASDGQAIYSLLRDYPGTIDVVIDGVAASAASLIAMAGDTVTMRLGSTMMIHDPAMAWVEGRGTEEDHLNVAKGLGVLSRAYAAVYAAFAGISVDQAREIMRHETYFDGPAALEAGFATAVDDGIEAVAAARFDYSIYAGAPAALRKAGGPKTPNQMKQTVLAMMAGQGAPQPKEIAMSEDAQLEDQTSDEDQDAEDTEDEMTADSAQASDATDGENEEAADATETAATAAQLQNLCRASNRPADEALDMVVRGLTLAQAVTEIANKREKENPVTIRSGGPRTTIMRDERETRRVGMAQAIAAQVGRAQDVSSMARPFMSLSLPEMAALCIGHKGSLRTSGDRQRVLMDASHTTSDFPAIFENALNKRLLEQYSIAEPTYRRIAQRKDFNDFRPHPLIRTGDFPTLQKVNENGEITYGTFGENREIANINSYAVAIAITRQMMINDELGAIDEVLRSSGQAVARFEEETFYKTAFTAELSDGETVLAAAHNNIDQNGSAITVESVGAGRAGMRQQTSIDGKRINLSPSILLVGPQKETEAEQLVATIQPQEAGSVNPFSGRLEVVVTAEITGNEWYLLAGADRAGGACWVYGHLDGADAPRLRTEEPFGRQGMVMSLELDFGSDPSDFRGAWMNPGD